MSQTSLNLSHLYYQMLRIRRVEVAIAERYHEQQMRCPTHLCIGQEAIAVGICSQLTIKDKVFSNHRGHGHYLAKGGDLSRLIAELYGFAEGCCGGRGGSMHLSDLTSGFIASTPIVGGTVPLAAGYAWAEQLRKTGNIVVIFFGDGCFEEGVMHETMNFAVLKKLPLLFVCENNQYSVMTDLAKRQPEREIYQVAAAHGMFARQGDGNNIAEIFVLGKTALAKLRDGLGPQFLEFNTHRWPEHCGPNEDDELAYRKPGELKAWKLRCPLLQAKAALLADGIHTEAELTEFESLVDNEIATAFQWALQGTAPTLESMGEHLYA